MRRVRLYLDDHLWNALQARARIQKTTIPELVREAVRERYRGQYEAQRKAMQEFVGVRKDSPNAVDTVSLVRRLRHGNRLNW